MVALERIPAIELNTSCPNVGNREACRSEFIHRRLPKWCVTVRKGLPKTLIVKLSPNVTDIARSLVRGRRGRCDVTGQYVARYG